MYVNLVCCCGGKNHFFICHCTQDSQSPPIPECVGLGLNLRSLETA